MSYIKVENLKYRYPGADRLALDDISLEIEKGSFVGVVGANGAGKSTLCQAFAGLVPGFYKGAYGGKVWIDGLEAAKTPISELCRKAGLVFQNPFNQLSGAKDTVFEEIAFGLQNFGVPKEEMIRRVTNVMKMLDIDAYGDCNPFDLSGGQMQRVALAGILAMEPDVILLDEPTSQLDPAGSEEVFRAVLKLAKSGITIIMVEQKMEKLAQYCDRLLLLHEGKQIAFDTPERIFSREDLNDYGIKAPIYTEICRKFEVQKENGLYPVSLAETLLLRDRFPKEEQDRGGMLQEHTAGTEPVFEISRLNFHYLAGKPVIKELKLTVDARPTAIVGQNGAGKTTLVKILKGLLKPVSGTVRYRGTDIGDKTVAMLAGEIGYVFQNPDDQIFKYHVMDEVMFGPLNIGMDKAAAEKKAKEALDMVGLLELADKNPYDLELSERKLVAIASVLAMETQVLILDEPTIAQDMYGKQTIKNVIRSMEKQGRSVIAILHDMDFVAECFERVIVMAHGTVLADGTKEAVFAQEDVLKEARIEQPYVTGLFRELGFCGMYFSV